MMFKYHDIKLHSDFKEKKVPLQWKDLAITNLTKTLLRNRTPVFTNAFNILVV